MSTPRQTCSRPHISQVHFTHEQRSTWTQALNIALGHEGLLQISALAIHHMAASVLTWQPASSSPFEKHPDSNISVQMPRRAWPSQVEPGGAKPSQVEAIKAEPGPDEPSWTGRSQVKPTHSHGKGLDRPGSHPCIPKSYKNTMFSRVFLGLDGRFWGVCVGIGADPQKQPKNHKKNTNFEMFYIVFDR